MLSVLCAGGAWWCCTCRIFECNSLVVLNRIPLLLLLLPCREEIASCSERAYGHLTLTDAQKVMMFKDQKELLAYAQEVRVGWHMSAQRLALGF